MAKLMSIAAAPDEDNQKMVAMAETAKADSVLAVATADAERAGIVLVPGGVVAAIIPPDTSESEGPDPAPTHAAIQSAETVPPERTVERDPAGQYPHPAAAGAAWTAEAAAAAAAAAEISAPRHLVAPVSPAAVDGGLPYWAEAGSQPSTPPKAPPAPAALPSSLPEREALWAAAASRANVTAAAASRWWGRFDCLRLPGGRTLMPAMTAGWAASWAQFRGHSGASKAPITSASGAAGGDGSGLVGCRESGQQEPAAASRPAGGVWPRQRRPAAFAQAVGQAAASIAGRASPLQQPSFNRRPNLHATGSVEPATLTGGVSRGGGGGWQWTTRGLRRPPQRPESSAGSGGECRFPGTTGDVMMPPGGVGRTGGATSPLGRRRRDGSDGSALYSATAAAAAATSGAGAAERQASTASLLAYSPS
jgi:hypothetical protein